MASFLSAMEIVCSLLSALFMGFYCMEELLDGVQVPGKVTTVLPPHRISSDCPSVTCGPSLLVSRVMLDIVQQIFNEAKNVQKTY